MPEDDVGANETHIPVVWIGTSYIVADIWIQRLDLLECWITIEVNRARRIRDIQQIAAGTGRPTRTVLRYGWRHGSRRPGAAAPGKHNTSNANTQCIAAQCKRHHVLSPW